MQPNVSRFLRTYLVPFGRVEPHFPRGDNMTMRVRASEVARMLKSPLVGPDMDIEGVCALNAPIPGRLCYSGHPLDRDTAAKLASCLTLVPSEVGEQPAGPHISVPRPRAAYAAAVEKFFVKRKAAALHPTAIVGEHVVLGENVSLGAYTMVGDGVTLGPRTVVRNHVTIGPGVRIGSDCLIKSGSVIGEDGFGMDIDEGGNNIRVPHLGSVIIGDHVEVGALTTVCAGTIADTTIEDYVKIDDHVFIAHNVRIGSNSLVIACSEVSGSVTIGERVWLGPNCSIMNGITIGDRATIGLGAVVTKSVDADQVVMGNPARPRAGGTA